MLFTLAFQWIHLSRYIVGMPIHTDDCFYNGNNGKAPLKIKGEREANLHLSHSSRVGSQDLACWHVVSSV